MELEFPGFVLLLLVAIGLAVLGPDRHAACDRPDGMAAITETTQCAGAAPCTAY